MVLPSSENFKFEKVKDEKNERDFSPWSQEFVPILSILFYQIDIIIWLSFLSISFHFIIYLFHFINFIFTYFNLFHYINLVFTYIFHFINLFHQFDIWIFTYFILSIWYLHTSNYQFTSFYKFDTYKFYFIDFVPPISFYQDPVKFSHSVNDPPFSNCMDLAIKNRI